MQRLFEYLVANRLDGLSSLVAGAIAPMLVENGVPVANLRPAVADIALVMTQGLGVAPEGWEPARWNVAWGGADVVAGTLAFYEIVLAPTQVGVVLDAVAQKV